MAKQKIIATKLKKAIFTIRQREAAAGPHWPGGPPAYTLRKSGVCICYDLLDEFPATLSDIFIVSQRNL